MLISAFPFKTYTQCPAPTCTYTAASGSSYTVNFGETICIPNGVNYNSGTITLNGGTIHVVSGGTLNANNYVSTSHNITNATNTSPIVVTTATAHGMSTGQNAYIRSVGGNTNANSHIGTPYVGEHIITSLSATTFSIDGSSGNNAYSSGGVLNIGGKVINCGNITNTLTNSSNDYLTSIDNYSNGNTLSVSFDSKQGPIINNYGTGLNLAIGNWNDPGTIYNASGASMTIVSSPFSIEANSIIENNGTLSWTPAFNTEPGVTINNNAGGIINLNNASRSDFRGAIVNNSGDINMSAGAIFQSSALITNNATGNITSSSGLFDITTNSIIHNHGGITGYDVRFQGTATVNMNDGSEFTVSHQVKILDYPLTAVSGCSFIDLGTATTIEATSSLNADLTQGGTGTTLVCGKVPYYTTDEITITNATNTSPITLTIASNINGRVFDGAELYVNGVVGNTAANGLWTVANYNAGSLTFDLISSSANGAYTSGGKVYYRHKWGSNASYLSYSGCTASDPCTALPVTWLHFDAQLLQNKVQLNWSTLDEINNDHFEIQRSLDGINFHTIQVISANNHTGGINQYSQFDHSPLVGQSYYRIMQVDLNGTGSYTNIESIHLNNTVIKVYPNPTDGNQLFLSTSNSESIIQVTITDILGKELFKIDKNINQINDLSSYTKDLSNGLYFINVYESLKKHIYKIVIN